MNILVTGGAGYIGSHTCVELLQAGHRVVVVDNLSNSKLSAVTRVQEIAGSALVFIEGDIRDSNGLAEIMIEHQINAVIHFAGLKAVGESSEIPVDYYDNNVGGTISLLKAMNQAQVKTIVFSSSATVYGEPHQVPITEDFPVSAINPYGWSKLMVEQILMDAQSAAPDVSVTLLRYFNPVGAHESGLIGEDPKDRPNNLMPYIAQVAIGRLSKLRVFGNDYPTRDGTGVRDYIHVVDLALGHLAALDRHGGEGGLFIYNLGTGQGVSVLEMRAAFEEQAGVQIPFEFVDRRPGDVAECWADVAHAEHVLGWRAKRDLRQMTQDAWRWQTKNPDGYPA